MSRSGSRYPSAFGHTPSYRSVSRLGVSSDPYGFDSSSLGLETRLGSSLGSNLGSSLRPSTYTSLSNTTPSYGSLSTNSPHQSVQYSTSSTTKSMQQVNDGVPKYSFSQASNNYSSDEPWKNRSTNYSYNL